MLSLMLSYGIAAIFVLAIVGTALAAPVLAYSFVGRLDRIMPQLVTVLACGLLILGGLLNVRNLQYASYGAAFIEAEGSSAFVWASRIINLIVVTLSLPYLAGKFMVFVRDGAKIYWPVIIVVAFGVTSYVLPAIYGSKPGFDHRLLYPILVVLVLLVGDPKTEEIVAVLKWALAAYFGVSLAFIVIEPNRVLAPGFHGFVPGFNSRFWGLASHANAIAPMAVLCLFLEWFIPSKSRMARVAIIALSLLTIVLAQSRTAIVGAGIGMLIMLYLRYAYERRSVLVAGSIKPHIGQVTVFVSLLMLTLGALIASLFGVLDGFIGKFFDSKLGTDLQTLTGRDVIWRVAIDEWQRNPWFGYGASLWSLDYRISVGLNYAFHAHNQFIQTLAEAGLVGLLGLLPLYAAFMVSAFRTRVLTLGASLALMLLLALRSITEVPLRPSGIGTGEMLLMIAVVAVWRLSYVSEAKVRVGTKGVT